MLQVIECFKSNFLQLWFAISLLWITYKAIEPRCISENNKDFKDVLDGEKKIESKTFKKKKRFKPKVDLGRIVVDSEVYKRAEELENIMYPKTINLTGKQVLDIALVVCAKFKDSKECDNDVYKVSFKALALIENTLMNKLSDKGYDIRYTEESLSRAIVNENGYVKNNDCIQYIDTASYLELDLANNGISKYLINDVISIIKGSKMKSKLILEEDWEED